MFDSFRNWLFGPSVSNVNLDYGKSEIEKFRVDYKPEVSNIVVGDIVFRRRFVCNVGGLKQFEYFCPKCDSGLVGGPENGINVNMICTKCDHNYGCLPDSWSL